MDHTIRQLPGLVGPLPLENINVAPHAEEIRLLCDSSEPWGSLSDETADYTPFTRF
jgi:hypothetical protein